MMTDPATSVVSNCLRPLRAIIVIFATSNGGFEPGCPICEARRTLKGYDPTLTRLKLTPSRFDHIMDIRNGK